jgi:hypothetical protein
MAAMIRTLSRVVLAAAMCVGAIAGTARAQASASISAETSEGSDPMQASWVGCVIRYQGKVHECSMSGLQVPTTGIARVSGVLHDVKNIADVAGTYKAVGQTTTLGAAT